MDRRSEVTPTIKKEQESGRAAEDWKNSIKKADRTGRLASPEWVALLVTSVATIAKPFRRWGRCCVTTNLPFRPKPAFTGSSSCVDFKGGSTLMDEEDIKWVPIKDLRSEEGADQPQRTSGRRLFTRPLTSLERSI